MQSDLPTEVAAWREAIRHLSRDVPPCRHLNAQRWGEMRDAAMEFIDRFGPEAHRYGWSAVELFGVHPEHGTLRVDWCGALMICGRKATDVHASSIGFDGMTARRGLPGNPEGIPIWELKGIGLRLP